MTTNNQNTFFRDLVIIEYLIIGVLIIFLILPKPTFLVKIDNISQCDNLPLKNASRCVSDWISDFYRYNLSNTGKDLTLTQLQAEGGVCTHWSEFYAKIGKDLGFYTQTPVIKTATYDSHTFAIWNDETGYCILDENQYPYCVNFVGDEK